MNNLTEQEQLEVLKENGCVIQFITNPSEAVQLEAVREHGGSIKYISNPNKAVQLEAVKQHGNNICYINSPTEEVINQAINTTIEKLYITTSGLCYLLGVNEIEIFNNGDKYYWGDPVCQNNQERQHSREYRHKALEFIRCILLDKVKD